MSERERSSSFGKGNGQQETKASVRQLPIGGINPTPQELDKINRDALQRKWQNRDDSDLIDLDETPITTLTNTEMVASRSMSLVEKSANHMFKLLKNLDSREAPEINAACNVAKAIQGLLRLQLDAIKLAKEFEKK